MKSAIGRIAAAAIATIVLVAGGIVAGPVGSAQAITGADFNPGLIISDSQFYDNDAMTEAEIQNFLQTRINEVGGCLDSNCLANFRMNTWTRPADRTVCAQYTGAASESAARIIFKTQQACGISAKVLLVTLQKEQSLLSARSPSSWQMTASMGYGCPDTAPCDAQFYGFYNQMYKAAWQFKRYSTPDPWGSYQPGANYIQYNPNAGCGGSWVNIQNNATAALYNYTPYQPNAASLANLYGSGGSCGAHGNRNFWTYFWGWFGSPTTVVPLVTTERIGGTDRYDTAVLLSKARGPVLGDTVYIANAFDYPDALSAAPAATKSNAPLLLVPPDSLPPVVAAELTRLKPRLIVVVGGEPSISAALYTQLATYSTEIRRDGGADRFETSRILAEKAFPADTTITAYLATGLGFADALSAGAAAGHKNAPVILTNGGNATIDEATVATLNRLGVNNVVIVGGEPSVSAGIFTSARDAGFTVYRLAGKDRWETAQIVNRNAFGSSATVFLASGVTFPDALAGAALAGASHSALLLSYTTCVNRGTAQTIIDMKATRVVVLGGTPSLANSVMTYQNCD